MAKVPLRDVVAGAHRALEAGDHGLARATCQHILAEYSCFADMHRLYGEIMLEQGEAAIARQSFEQALAYDPQNVLATLGLGVLAEEGLDLASAAGYFQQALEIDPSLSQLRDELVRLYSKLYGHGGRLHLSGPGLAAIYARGNQLTLAQRQYETTLARQPNRLDLMLSLAEVRWRAGDLAGAELLCQQILGARPRTLRALYIQADLYRRHGATHQAETTFALAATIDPLHDTARALEQANPSCSFTPLVRELSEITAFDPSQAGALLNTLTTNASLGVAPPTEENEWRRITTELNPNVVADLGVGAGDAEPSFQWPWETEVQPATPPMPEPVPPSAASPASPAMPAPIPAPPTSAPNPELVLTDWNAAALDIDAARPSAVPSRGYTDTLREIDALGFKPFDEDAADLDADLSLNLAAFDSQTLVVEAPPVAPAPTQSVPVAATPAPAARVMPAPSSAPAAPPTPPMAATPPTPPAPPLPIAPPAPATPPAPAVAAPPPVSPMPARAATPDEAAAALAELVGDWDNIDAELAAARPADSTFDLGDLGPDLGADGLQPFAADGEASSFESLSGASWAAPTERPAARDDTLVNDSWADLDRQLSAAVPASQMPRGFTGELRALSDEGLAPFSFDELDPIEDRLAPAPPAASAAPPAAPRPAAPPPTPAAPAENDRTWADFEAELAMAIPVTNTLPHGFTADLRELDSQGLTPFLAEDLAIDIDSASSLARESATDPGHDPLDLLTDTAPARGLAPPPVPPAAPVPTVPEVPAAPVVAPVAPPVMATPRPPVTPAAPVAPPVAPPAWPERATTTAPAPVTPPPLPVMPVPPPPARPAAPHPAAAMPPAKPAAPVAPTLKPVTPAMPPVPPPAPAPPLMSPPAVPQAAVPTPPRPAAPRPAVVPTPDPLSLPRPRSLPLGSTISLAGSLFARLRDRKQELVDLGQITLRPAAPTMASGHSSAQGAQAALRQAEAASDEQPADPMARLQLATMYAETGQPVDAALCYRLLLRGEPALLAELAAPIEHLAATYPEEPRVLRLLGDLYLRQGRYSQAMTVFQSLLVAGASA